MNSIRKLSKLYKNRMDLPHVEYIDLSIFSKPYPKNGCFAVDCRDICCSGGATMDITTYNKLRAYRDVFPAIPWDSFTFTPDTYSPGGQGCYTLFDNKRCMFLNSRSRGCAIHSYCLNRGIDYREIKFFTCCLFPCEVNHRGDIPNVLTAGYELRMPGFSLPCRDRGEHTIYAEARENILYYYGGDLIKEIEELAGGKS